MSEVINLNDRKTKKVPHFLFLVLCLTCKNKWIALVPKGANVFGLECNKCTSINSFASYLPKEFNDQ